MLYDQVSVRANIRNREGRRVFFLGKGDSLTPTARDWLQAQRIEILPAEQAKIRQYALPDGATSEKKPEEMTHLRGNILVPKTSPIIAFRGAIDSLQAEILWAQLSVAPDMRRKLEEILLLARNILRWEVMQEPAVCQTLCGLTEEQLHQRSHLPQQYYGIAHFMPSWEDGAAILALNRVRCKVRNAELAAARAFCPPEGGCERGDILLLLNRMSSMIYVLMIELKAKGGRHGTRTSEGPG